jgi:hypothetical protein
MVSTALGDLSERTSVLWLVLSPAALVVFRGAMIVVILQLCYLLQGNS